MKGGDNIGETTPPVSDAFGGCPSDLLMLFLEVAAKVRTRNPLPPEEDLQTPLSCC